MKTGPLSPLGASLTPGPQAPSPPTARDRAKPVAAPGPACPPPRSEQSAPQGIRLGGHVPELSRTLRGSADFDAHKVESVRRAIANGSFRVNAHAVADRLLDNAEELLARARADAP